MAESEKWEQIKVLVETLDLDVSKFERGNASAGVRSRKGLRTLKKWAADLVKEMVTLDKERKSAKPVTE